MIEDKNIAAIEVMHDYILEHKILDVDHSIMRNVRKATKVMGQTIKASKK